MIIWYPNQQKVAQLGFYILGDRSSLGKSRRSSKDGLPEHLCMYMPIVVSSGSSVRILYPRESYDSWAYPEDQVRTVCQSTTWQLVRILYPRESYDSWADHEGPLRMVCQSTTWQLVRILYPRGSYDSWANPEGPVRRFCQSTCACICQLWSIVVAPLRFYILGNIMIHGHIPKVW